MYVSLAGEIGQDGDVDSHRAEDGQPCGLQIHGATVGKLFVEMEVKVTYQDLEPGHRLEDIVMRERHNMLLRVVAVLRAQVQVDSHVLQSTWRRII